MVYTRLLKRFLWLNILISLCGILLTAIFIYDSRERNKSVPSSTDADFPVPAEVEDSQPQSEIVPVDPIREKISQLTIEEKVGQMFIFGFQGTTPTPYILRYISEYKIGGVMMLYYNMPDEATTRANISALQAHNSASPNSIPLFFAIDQEGGRINGVRYWDASMNTSQKSITSIEQAREVSFQRSSALKDLGLNLNFAPTADYITDNGSFLYTRAFAGDPPQVGGLAEAMVEGADDAGMITSIKHFPGHTNYAVDTHKNLASFKVTEEEMNNSLKTFEASLLQSPPDVVMMAHVRYENYDSENIASLSSHWIGERLRGEYKYDGVVITDDMLMKSVSKTYGIEGAAVQAVLAGEDILLYVSSPEIQKDAYEAVLNAVKDGRISEDRIDQSVYRILKLKSDKLGYQP